jgi:uncharacterized protein with PIN domain
MKGKTMLLRTEERKYNQLHECPDCGNLIESDNWNFDYDRCKWCNEDLLKKSKKKVPVSQKSKQILKKLDRIKNQGHVPGDMYFHIKL